MTRPRKRKMYDAPVFDSIGRGKRLTLTRVSPLAQTLARAKKLVAYKRVHKPKTGTVKRKKAKRRKNEFS